MDQYDLDGVDECHRGYLLDREMSDAELSFRERGRLHLQVPPRPRTLRRGEDRPHCHSGPAHHRNLWRADLHLLVPGGRDRRLPDRPRAASAHRDRLARAGIISRKDEQSICSTPRPARSISASARRAQLRGRGVQPAGYHRAVQPGRGRGAGQAHRSRAARQDADLCRQPTVTPTSWWTSSRRRSRKPTARSTMRR